MLLPGLRGPLARAEMDDCREGRQNGSILGSRAGRGSKARRDGWQAIFTSLTEGAGRVAFQGR